MYKLYWAPDTGALAPQAMLEEIGLPYEKAVIDFSAREHRAPAYLAINPFGRVPAMQLPDGSIMTESAAMVLYLVDRHPEAGLAPAPDEPERARFLLWLLFMACEVYGADLRHYHPDHYCSDPAAIDSVKAAGLRDLEAQLALIEAELEPGPYLLGTRYSALDPYLLMLVGWHPQMDQLLARMPRLKRLCDLLRERPAIAKVWAEHAEAA